MELLVGLALMGLLAGAAYKLIDSSSSSEQQNRAQNAQADQLRAAMAGVRADLRDATAIKSVTPSKGMDGAATGITFERVETSSTSVKTCVTERIDLVGTTVKSTVARKTSCNPDATVSEFPDLDSGTARVVVDNVDGLCSTDCSTAGSIPFLRFFTDATKPSITVDTTPGKNALNPVTWLGDVGLAEVNLKRDGDGSSGLLRASALKSTVYLANIAERSTGTADSFCAVP